VVEKLLAGITFAVCVILFIRLLLGARRQQRFDATVRRAAAACRRSALSAWRWRSSRKEAVRVAEEAIRRARDDGNWEGNVYRPKSFRRPRKPH
jgi:hypothetical protein